MYVFLKLTDLTNAGVIDILEVNTLVIKAIGWNDGPTP